MTYLNSNPPNNLCNSAILDSDATGNFLAFDAPCIHKEKALHPLSITLPDGTIIESTNTSMFALPGLPPAANQAHLFPNHFKHSLILVGHLCYHGCEVIFYDPSVTVSKEGLSLYGMEGLLHGPLESRPIRSTHWRAVDPKRSKQCLRKAVHGGHYCISPCGMFHPPQGHLAKCHQGRKLCWMASIITRQGVQVLAQVSCYCYRPHESVSSEYTLHSVADSL
jgi:hypothetical protein